MSWLHARLRIAREHATESCRQRPPKLPMPGPLQGFIQAPQACRRSRRLTTTAIFGARRLDRVRSTLRAVCMDSVPGQGSLHAIPSSQGPETLALRSSTLRLTVGVKDLPRHLHLTSTWMKGDGSLQGWFRL